MPDNLSVPQASSRPLTEQGLFTRVWYDWLAKIDRATAGLQSAFDTLQEQIGGGGGEPPTLGTAALKNIGTEGDTVPVLNAPNKWSKQQWFDLATLTDGATIAWDVEAAQVARVTLGGTRTLANPSNMKAGATYILIVHAGANDLNFDTAYKWPNATPPTMDGTCVLTFVCDGSLMYGVAVKAFG